MTLELFGLTLHEADVALTDVGLALLGGVFAARLWARRATSALRREGAILNAGLASAAVFGAVFHAFFPAKTSTAPGFLAWIPVIVSIAIAAAAMLLMAMRLLSPRMPRDIRWALASGYAMVFVLWALLIDESYGTIVRFYGPALLLLSGAALRKVVQQTDRGWGAVSTGLVLSILAAVLQQARLALHPVYFDHNALYHLVQAAALVLIYRGLTVVPDTA